MYIIVRKKGYDLSYAAILQRRMKIRMNATYIRLFYVCRLKFDNDGSRVSCQHHVLMITKAIWQPLSLLLIISQKRSKLLSMAVKILPPLIMQYLLNISNNSAQTNTVCVCTAVLIVDSITTAMLYSFCICYRCMIISKKRVDVCDNSKDGG